MFITPTVLTIASKSMITKPQVAVTGILTVLPIARKFANFRAIDAMKSNRTS